MDIYFSVGFLRSLWQRTKMMFSAPKKVKELERDFESYKNENEKRFLQIESFLDGFRVGQTYKCTEIEEYIRLEIPGDPEPLILPLRASASTGYPTARADLAPSKHHNSEEAN